MSDTGSTISAESSESAQQTTTGSARVVKVAVVGTGLAGLVSAYYLATASNARVQYSVHLFDESSTIGFDSSSVTATDADGVSRRIDVPMRSFAGGYYSRVVSLYKSLGLQFHDAKFTYSFSELEQEYGDAKTYFLHGGRAGIFRQGGRPSRQGRLRWACDLIAVTFWYIYFSIIAAFARPKGGVSFENDIIPRHVHNKKRFGSEEVKKEYGTMNTDDESSVEDENRHIESLQEFARRWHIPTWFVNRFVVALFCAMSTCDAETILSAPAADIIDYKRKTFRKPHYLLSSNSMSAVSALTAPIAKENIHLGVAVKAMLSEGTTWTIRTVEEDYNHFSHVILATPPSRTAELHRPLVPVLRNVKANSVRVLVHTDDRVLNFLESDDIRDLNLLKTSTGTEATHVLFPGVYQTTSPASLNGEPGEDYGGRIAEDKVVSESVFERVVRTNGLVAAVGKMRRRQGRHNVWVVGSWMWDGLVLLEGCVASAEAVCAGIRRKCGDQPVPLPKGIV
ncbi:hypothetical protein POJ06DRAFT_247701 [Lipomyces tetrasporus]|uniref:Amine oxidase domain-containing protein n=1 Tax=Lipomyces tetrasporus TaxID=54092 RepID=A0AAD7VT32_9ASCO|nr:uncharacterized protein POJ06DRAFT_247701 [Lipomyces tetrasporus]KAJ8101722.1 hypothetical protein POJ06DRAFT_247701 [Lipomyces tetrasporus]